MLPAGVLAYVAIRIVQTAWSGPWPVLFYNDSASHLLHDWWSASGVLDGGGVGPVARITAALHPLGLPLIESRLALNAVLALSGTWFWAEPVRRRVDARAAAALAILLWSFPAMPRLVFSAQPELVAFWLVGFAWWASFLESQDRWRPFWVLIALWGAFECRPETGVFLAGWVAFMAWESREDRGRSATLLAVGALMFGETALGHLEYAQRLRTSITLFDRPEWTSRIGSTAQWLAFSVPVFTVLSGYGLSRAVLGGAETREKVWSVLAGAFAVALFGAALFGFHSLEFERVWLLPMAPLLAMACRSKRWGSLGAGACALVAVLSTASPYALLPRETSEARSVGKAVETLLGDLSPEDRVLVRAKKSGWTDILVFSGMEQRFRLHPSSDPGWGSVRAPEAGETFSVLIVRTGDSAGKEEGRSVMKRFDRLQILGPPGDRSRM